MDDTKTLQIEEAARKIVNENWGYLHDHIGRSIFMCAFWDELHKRDWFEILKGETPQCES